MLPPFNYIKIMCLNPKTLYNKGKYKEDTYKGKKGEDYEIVAFTKCGHCAECVNEKSNNWVIRNYYESKAHNKICFITLTYAENPIFLIKKHVQDFIKRLRRHLQYHKILKRNEKIRYFACGEYGTLYKRPHYHIIIYNWAENIENLEYIDINKKNNIIYKSSTIEKVWKYGRHTYQCFDTHEIPYITLYETANETMSYAYRTSRENAKNFIKQLKSKECKNVHRWYMINELSKEIKKQEKSKNDYISIKEFNTWSKALGWEEFYKGYIRQTNYDWNEYIEDKEYLTPTSWIKKLANKGDSYAIKEMLRRAQEMSNLTAKQLQEKNRLKWSERNVEKIKEWKQKKELTEL